MQKAAAAHAQAAHLAQLAAYHALPGTLAATVSDSELASNIIDNNVNYGYTGGVNHSHTESEYKPSMDSDLDDEVIKLEGEELEQMQECISTCPAGLK